MRHLSLLWWIIALIWLQELDGRHVLGDSRGLALDMSVQI